MCTASIAERLSSGHSRIPRYFSSFKESAIFTKPLSSIFVADSVRQLLDHGMHHRVAQEWRDARQAVEDYARHRHSPSPDMVLRHRHEFVQADDVRVLQFAYGRCLSMQACGIAAFFDHRWKQYFYGHRALQEQIFALEDLAHAALAKEFLHPVATAK